MIGAIRQTIVRLLKRRGYHLHASGYLESNFFELLLYELLKKNGGLYFVQIGANDGIRFDPIYGFVKANRHQVSGIVIEPLSAYFDQLCDTYRTFPNITPLNKAIHTSEKEMLIYQVSPDRHSDYPSWVTGISSFNKDKLIDSDGVDPGAIISEAVQCISLDQLIRENDLSSIDLLQIDTEGYDYEIISAIDFSLVKPKLIHFEHGLPKNIMSRQNLDKLRDLLHSNGYELWMKEWDALAYRSDAFVDLSPAPVIKVR